jgi:hypothetical protein
MDEIAADQKVDPVQFRMRYLGENKRGADALMAVVKQAAWQERPSPAPASSERKPPAEVWRSLIARILFAAPWPR